MQFILDKLESQKHLFEPGGKLEKLYPLFEAQDTFLFTPADTTSGNTHVRDSVDLKRVMITVVLALIPCVLWSMYNVGHNYYAAQGIDANILMQGLMGMRYVLPIILVSYIVGGLWEVLFCVVRKHEINEGFLVTGLLFPLTLPPTIPLLHVALGISFGVVIGKEIFGGTGYNILNPALTARAFVFFAYPKYIIGEVWTKLPEGVSAVAGYSMATPLGVNQALKGKGVEPTELFNGWEEAGQSFGSMLFGLEGGSLGETSVIPILIGLAILLITGLASWRIMAGGVVGLLGTGILLNALPTAINYPGMAIPFFFHLVLGSFLFGIVFMATDPVSAAATNRGKWIYGALIGVVTILIRVFNPAYPEGIMLAILFMNVMAPLIDHYVVRGHLAKRNKYIRKFNHA